MGYNVIWIDDEWDTRGKSFIQICKVKHQINITPFKTRKEGIYALEQDLKSWDAIILDAKAYNNTEDDVADVDGLYAAKERIIELRQQRYIPCFVLTRQPDLIDDMMFEKSVGKFYRKDDEGINKLIEDLIEEVSKSTRYQVRTIYKDAVEQLGDISVEAGEYIIDIFEAFHSPDMSFNPKLYFNPLRQVLEYIFRAANKVGILPDDFFSSGIVNLNQCFMFLIGKDAEKVGVRYGEPGERIVPSHIQNMMGLILNLGNLNSHSKLNDSELQAAEERFVREGLNSKYLVFSMALQLCEIAFWMNKYIASHPNKDENLQKCVKLPPKDEEKQIDAHDLIGIIELKDGFYHINDKYSVLLRHKEWLGKKARILKFTANTNQKLKELYPYFVHDNDIQIIEEPENGSK